MKEWFVRGRLRSITALGACVFVAATAKDARAQLNTQHIKGTVGLKGGSQAPPNVYVIAPLLYVYSTDTVKTSDGTRLPGNADLTSTAYGGGFNFVTTKKILGGQYGLQLLFPVAI